MAVNEMFVGVVGIVAGTAAQGVVAAVSPQQVVAGVPVDHIPGLRPMDLVAAAQRVRVQPGQIALRGVGVEDDDVERQALDNLVSTPPWYPSVRVTVPPVSWPNWSYEKDP